MSRKALQRELQKMSNSKRAAAAQRFFKTGKGEYAEGDVFLGIITPDLRKVTSRYLGLTFIDLQKLLKSSIHEYRFVALLVLVSQYQIAVKERNLLRQKQVVDFYIKNAEYVNNWDLVDTSASYILGHYILDRSRKILYTFARSKNLWKNRISIVSTHALIKHNDFKDSFAIATLLLSHRHDLIHKAVGWMLREIGSRNVKILEDFLSRNIEHMPRTTLRYAIEKFSPAQRLYYLHM